MGVSWSVPLRENQVYEKAKGDTDRKNWATLNSALQDETAARESVDAEIIEDKAALWTALQDETTLRAQDDYELRQEFLGITSSETSIRAAADVSLKAALDSDITTVKALIDTEKQDRITNDSAVIEQVNNKYDPQINDINTAIANENTLAAKRDDTMFSALSDSIVAEQNARSSADAALQTSINNLSNSAINSIRAEQTARQSADATLQQNIDKVAASITSGSFTVEEFKPSSTTQEGKAGILPAPPKLQTEDQILLPTNFGWKSLADTNIFIGTTPSQKFVPEYTGNVIYPSWNDYEEQKVSVSGQTSATAAGTYTVQFTPVGLYCWSDGTRGARSVQWTIAPALIAIPTAATTTFEYTGNVISLNPANVDLNKMTKSGTDSATEQGNYAVTYTLKDSANVHWSNNSTTPVTINWKIEIKQLDKPTAANTTFDYDGKTKTLKVNNYNASFMNMSGTTSTVNAGSYSVTYSLKNKTSMRWKDGTTNDVTINWVVNRQKLSYDESNLTSNPLEYTGNAQSVSLNGYNSAKHVLSGDTTKTAAGSYTVTVTPNSNYEWYEGGYGGKQITWTIGNLSFPKPTAATTTFTYTGNSISLNVQNVNLTYMDKTGSDTATAKGTYWVKYTLKSSSYTWDDGSKDPVIINWSIGENTVAIPTLSKTDYTYSGSSISAQITNGASDKFTVTGTTAAVNAGTYTITYTLNDKTNTKWTDGTTTNKTVEWTIKRKNLTAAQSTFTPKTITYDGNAKNLADNLTGYNATYHDLSSQTSMTNAGTYTAKVAPKANYAWNDGTYAAKTVSWTINPKSVTKPTAAKTSFDYDGSTKTLSISGYDSNYMTQSGTTSASAKGSYTVTFTLKSTTNYQWADGTTAAHVITWTIGANSVAKPTLSGTTSFTYDGNAKSVTVNGYDSTTMTFSGTISETNAGNYTATYALKDKTNYAWDDGTNADVKLTWSIAALKIPVNYDKANISLSQQASWTYNAALFAIIINRYDSTYHNWSGPTQGKNAGDYLVKLSPNQNYVWQDGSTDTITVTFTVPPRELDKPTPTSTSFTYDGTTKTVEFDGFDSKYMSATGIAASNVGTYTGRVIHKNNTDSVTNTIWKNGDGSDYTFQWQITAGNGITKPTLSTTEYEWTGGSISPTVSGYNSSTMTQGGTSTASAIGTYTVTYSLKDKTNTTWADGTTADVSLTWKIVRQKLTNDVTVDSGVTLTYNGNSQQPTLKYGSVQWTMANLATYCDLSSQTSATDAGTYTFKATPKSTYAWKDGGTAAKSFSWTINKAVVENICPSITNINQYYDGTTKSPTIPAYDTSIIAKASGSSDTAVEVGTYYIFFGLKDSANYEWNDGDTTYIRDNMPCRRAYWRIKAVTSPLTLSDDDITLSNSMSQTTVAVTYTGDGTVTVTSSNTETAIASISGKTVTVKAGTYSTETATVTVAAEATNNTSAASATLTVTSTYIPPFDSCSWTQIQQIIKAGRAAEQWSAGDYKNFSMSVNYRNTTASTSVNDWTYYKAVILGIDHNFSYEATSDINHYVDCVIMSRNNNPLLFDKFTYDTQPDSNNNYGAYSFRYGEEANLYQYLPSDLQNVIVQAKKYRQYGTMTILYSATLWGLSIGEVKSSNDGYDETHVYEYFANGNYAQLLTYPVQADTSEKFWSRDTDETKYQNYALALLPRSTNYETVHKNTALCILPCFRIGG